MTIEQINEEGKAIFGADYDFETEVGTIARYTEEQRLIGAEMDRFFDSLPAWVGEDAQFWLWMQPEAEREEWLKMNAPVKDTQAAYFQHTLTATATTKVGNIRF